MSSNVLSLNVTTTEYSKEWLFGLEQIVDPRTQAWLLVSSYKPVGIIVLVYLLAVLYLPKKCKSFKPLKLQKVLIAYNALMALLNLYVFKEVLITTTRLKYNYLCQPCRVVNTTHEIKLASAIWLFYISKILEFSDSAFFIARHKWNQLSPLHIYHHSSVLVMWWMAIKWVPTGSTFFPVLLNSFVHIIMYSYYGLSALGPKLQKYLWWKKYLTAIQLIQFAINFIWTLHSILSKCDYPMFINTLGMVYMTSFLILFGRFYKRQYQCKQPVKLS